MSTVAETPMKVNAFAEMKKMLRDEMNAQGLTASDIRKELPKKINEK